MDHHKAAALIAQHRRHWRLHEPDGAIARRAERSYRTAAVVFGIVAVGDAFTDLASSRFTGWRVGLGLVILAAAIAFYWQSYRFTQIRRLLTDAAAKKG